MMSFGTKSFSQDVVRSNICFERLDIEAYKTKCEMCKQELEDVSLALERALSRPADIAFYQEKPVALGAVLLAIGLGIALSAKK